MARWEPGAKERLQLAATSLFLEHGFEQTTVQDIAGSAGLTERTFFRHFADKREVLFAGQAEYESNFLDGVRAAPQDASTSELIRAALASASHSFFTEERRPWSRQRQEVIDANPALTERELLKRAALGDALTIAFSARGVPDLDARLAADTTAIVFSVAFRRWIEEEEYRAILEIAEESLNRLSVIMPVAAVSAE